MIANDIQAAVNTGGGPGGSDQAFIAGIQRITVQMDGRKSFSKVLFEFPVCCRTMTIKQTGIGQNIGP
ncbi:hypothetical protein D3C71_2193690 [compost metagenome]